MLRAGAVCLLALCLGAAAATTRARATEGETESAPASATAGAAPSVAHFETSYAGRPAESGGTEEHHAVRVLGVDIARGHAPSVYDIADDLGEGFARVEDVNAEEAAAMMTTCQQASDVCDEFEAAADEALCYARAHICFATIGLPAARGMAAAAALLCHTADAVARNVEDGDEDEGGDEDDSACPTLHRDDLALVPQDAAGQLARRLAPLVQQDLCEGVLGGGIAEIIGRSTGYNGPNAHLGGVPTSTGSGGADLGGVRTTIGTTTTQHTMRVSAAVKRHPTTASRTHGTQHDNSRCAVYLMGRRHYAGEARVSPLTLQLASVSLGRAKGMPTSFTGSESRCFEVLEFKGVSAEAFGNGAHGTAAGKDQLPKPSAGSFRARWCYDPSHTGLSTGTTWTAGGAKNTGVATPGGTNGPLTLTFTGNAVPVVIAVNDAGPEPNLAGGGAGAFTKFTTKMAPIGGVFRAATAGKDWCAGVSCDPLGPKGAGVWHSGDCCCPANPAANTYCQCHINKPSAGCCPPGQHVEVPLFTAVCVPDNPCLGLQCDAQGWTKGSCCCPSNPKASSYCECQGNADPDECGCLPGFRTSHTQTTTTTTTGGPVVADVHACVPETCDTAAVEQRVPNVVYNAVLDELFTTDCAIGGKLSPGDARRPGSCGAPDYVWKGVGYWSVGSPKMNQDKVVEPCAQPGPYITKRSVTGVPSAPRRNLLFDRGPDAITPPETAYQLGP